MYCLHYVFRCCGGRTRTCDLQVMSLASYQLLHSAILTICVIQNVDVMSLLNCECKGMAFLLNLQMFWLLFYKNFKKSAFPPLFLGFL